MVPENQLIFFSSVLMLGFWGAANSIFAAIRMLNESKDKIFFGNSNNKFTKEQMKSIFYLDWLPLWIGIIISTTIFGLYLGMLVKVFHNMLEKNELLWIGGSVPILILLVAIAFLVTGCYEIKEMKKIFNE